MTPPHPWPCPWQTPTIVVSAPGPATPMAMPVSGTQETCDRIYDDKEEKDPKEEDENERDATTILEEEEESSLISNAFHLVGSASIEVPISTPSYIWEDRLIPIELIDSMMKIMIVPKEDRILISFAKMDEGIEDNEYSITQGYSLFRFFPYYGSFFSSRCLPTCYNTLLPTFTTAKGGAYTCDVIRFFSCMCYLGSNANGFTLSSIISYVINVIEQFHSLTIALGNGEKGFKIDMFMLANMLIIFMVGWIVNAIKVFKEVDDPDLVMWNMIIQDTCSMMRKQMHGKTIKIESPRNQIPVDNALVSMYAKCGNLKDANMLFEMMHQRNMVSFNTMITPYAQHGFGLEELELFKVILDIENEPTNIMFILVLSTRSRTRKVDEGWKYFDSMRQNFVVAVVVMFLLVPAFAFLVLIEIGVCNNRGGE
ncbi:hypothetical protein ZIOFF_013601 [Zingiber officinale]|uniref:Pentatricopeptide repeat-containing protein n=1 Tax=Zingiber officinale TaxID=94328 RepID=A0A8J5LQF7_ZINOF|nr:hypothetical protein ZIOFF_013601 [Zingiber officinale]